MKWCMLLIFRHFQLYSYRTWTMPFLIKLLRSSILIVTWDKFMFWILKKHWLQNLTNLKNISPLNQVAFTSPILVASFTHYLFHAKSITQYQHNQLLITCSNSTIRPKRINVVFSVTWPTLNINFLALDRKSVV